MIQAIANQGPGYRWLYALSIGTAGTFPSVDTSFVSRKLYSNISRDSYVTVVDGPLSHHRDLQVLLQICHQARHHLLYRKHGFDGPVLPVEQIHFHWWY